MYQQHQNRRRFPTLTRPVMIMALFLLLLIGTSAVVLAGKSSIGDFVWHDSNANGVADIGEVGINNVVVNLYRDGANGNPIDGILQPGEFISTTTTAFFAGSGNVDNNGYYDFNADGLEVYFVEVPASNFNVGGPLEFYVYTGEVPTASPIYAGPNPRTVILTSIQQDFNDADFPFARAGIRIVKTAGNAPDGTVEYLQGPPPVNVTYRYTVTNTGEVPIDIDRANQSATYGLTDNLCSPVTYSSGDTNNNNLLDLNEVWVYTCTSTINTNNPVTNTATVVGNPVDSTGADLPGNNVTATDTAVVDVVNPAVDIQKTVYLGHNSGASCPGVELVTGPPGAAVTYCFTVTNTGDTHLRVNINDPLLGIVNGAGLTPLASPALPALLAPGASATYYFQTTINGNLVNTATVTGTPTDPGGTPLPDIPNVTDTDTAQVREEVRISAIGDFVWYDADQDGIQDPGEPGIGSVTLSLIRDNGDNILGPGDTVVATTTTGVNGGYIFSNLPAGVYFVDVTDTAGVLAGHVKSTGPQSMPDPTGPITLAVAQFYEDADFGYYKPTVGNEAVIGDTVWYDYDADGFRDPGEPGIPGVTVIITDSLGNVYTGVTGPDGTYHIVVIADGVRTYTVAPNPATLPPGLTATTPVPHLVPPLAPGSQYLEADFGYDSPQLGAIGNQIWRDTVKDGFFDSTQELGIPGVTVNLYRDDGDGVPEPNELFATLATDSNGQYLFTGLPAGNYLVRVSDTANVLANYVPTTIIGGNADNTNKAQPYAVALAAGQTNLTADFGYVLNDLNVDKGIIGNQVWFEMDGDGIYEPLNGEIGLAGVTVLLYRNGQLVGSQETGSFGLYAFNDLPAGTYTVTIANSVTNTLVLGNLNVTTIIGGNADNTNKPRPYTVTLPTNTSINMTADFGYTEPSNYAISKVLTSANPAIIGQPVTFTIRITNTGESWIATLPLTDTFDNRYLGFVSASPAPNSVSNVGIVGRLRWNDLTGAGQLAPNGVIVVTVRFTALANTADPANPDSPVTFNTASVSGTVFDADGPTGPLPPLPVDLPKSSRDDVQIGQAPEPGAIGDLVWYDEDQDGFQDPGEPGIPNVLMVLYNAITGSPVATTTTGVDGGYIFKNLAPGTYIVNVASASDPNGPLNGLTHVVGNQSKPDPTGPITIGAGQFYQDADFGYYKPTVGNQAVIGDTVWYDYDGDGIRDPGEPGIPGVTVIITDSNGATYSAVTDQNGNYLIVVPTAPNLSYTVAPNPATLPPNLAATTPVPHLVQPLSPGDQYLNADFGYRPTQSQLGVIGNQVWEDLNNNGFYDGFEPGIPGVTVNLYRDDGDGIPEVGELVGTTVTDQNGRYLFTGYPAGNYLVQVSDTANVLADYQPTLVTGNPGDSFNKAQPYPVALAAGQTNLTADFGYIKNPNRVDRGIIGNQVWFEMDGDGLYEPQNGEIGLDGLTVLLYNNGQLVDTRVTGPSGLYAFTGLSAGVYTVTLANNVTNTTILGNLNITAIIGGNADNTNKAQPYSVPLPPDGVNMTADFGYTQPSNYVISKLLTIPGVEPVKRGSLITFTIRITNTGESWIETLPLTDTYDNRFLTYNGATPAPNSVSNVGTVGTLRWDDLTGNAQLPPNGVITVIVRFIASGDTTDPATNPTAPVTINRAGVTDPRFDPDGPTGPLPPLPASTPKQAQDDVRILDPTSVLIAEAKLDSQSDHVTVMWKTANEADVLGFNVLRTVDGVTTRLNATMIVAQFSGQANTGSYSWDDLDVEVGKTYFYFIEIITTSGTQEHSVGSTLVLGGNKLFLPLVTKK